MNNLIKRKTLVGLFNFQSVFLKFGNKIFEVTYNSILKNTVYDKRRKSTLINIENIHK